MTVTARTLRRDIWYTLTNYPDLRFMYVGVDMTYTMDPYTFQGYTYDEESGKYVLTSIYGSTEHELTEFTPIEKMPMSLYLFFLSFDQKTMMNHHKAKPVFSSVNTYMLP